MLVIFSVAAGWHIYDIASVTGAPGAAVMIMQGMLLAGLSPGIAGTTSNAARARRDQREPKRKN